MTHPLIPQIIDLATPVAETTAQAQAPLTPQPSLEKAPERTKQPPIAPPGRRQNSRRHQSERRPSRLAVPHKIWETSRYSNLQKPSKSNQNSQKLWKRRLNRAAPADLHRELLPNLATRKDRAGKALVAQ